MLLAAQESPLLLAAEEEQGAAEEEQGHALGGAGLLGAYPSCASRSHSYCDGEIEIEHEVELVREIGERSARADAPRDARCPSSEAPSAAAAAAPPPVPPAPPAPPPPRTVGAVVGAVPHAAAVVPTAERLALAAVVLFLGGALLAGGASTAWATAPRWSRATACSGCCLRSGCVRPDGGTPSSSAGSWRWACMRLSTRPPTPPHRCWRWRPRCVTGWGPRIATLLLDHEFTARESLRCAWSSVCTLSPSKDLFYCDTNRNVHRTWLSSILEDWSMERPPRGARAPPSGSAPCALSAVCGV